LSLSAALLERRDDGCRSCGFFFQAEDGIRDFHVTGVQTCALPISSRIPSLQHHFFSLMSREIQEDRALHMLLSKKSADDRIASLLTTIAARQQRRGLSNRIFRLPMSRYDIANYLGLAVETVSRIFTRFQQQGLIRV